MFLIEFAKSLLLCPTLCDPMDHNPPGFSVHGILQARILELVAISSSRDLPDSEMEPVALCLLHWQADSLPLSHQGSILPALIWRLSETLSGPQGDI